MISPDGASTSTTPPLTKSWLSWGVGRKDYLDVLFFHQHHLSRDGALCWAAAGKDPEVNPFMILQECRRTTRFQPEHFRELILAKPLDLQGWKLIWLQASREAEQLLRDLPPEEIGWDLDADGKPVTPNPKIVEFPSLTRHFGSVRGGLADNSRMSFSHLWFYPGTDKASFIGQSGILAFWQRKCAGHGVEINGRTSRGPLPARVSSNPFRSNPGRSCLVSPRRPDTRAHAGPRRLSYAQTRFPTKHSPSCAQLRATSKDPQCYPALCRQIFPASIRHAP